MFRNRLDIKWEWAYRGHSIDHARPFSHGLLGVEGGFWVAGKPEERGPKTGERL
jgi:hypothetical protein